MRLLIFVTLAFFSVAIFSQEITGTARVIDGDSIRIADVEIRLHGIDAPEAKQMCKMKGQDWRCGHAATETLSFLLVGATIRCSWTERDQYDRALATCYRKDTNLNEMMVGVGMAFAYQQYSDIYVTQEKTARDANMGLWDSQFVPPWDWRRGVRLAGNESPDSDCPVKGNVNRKGDRIYHVKGWRDHAKVRLKPEGGDTCFQAVLDAELAGFRPAQQ
jgi:endonuclease YncB( thermonuclease family)